MRKLLLLAFVAMFAASCAKKALPPQPYGAVPTKEQMEWQKMEYYMFIHFGPNTFTDKEWGHGDEDPKIFNPTNLDCRQWAATAKAAGMKAIIITAKHHDGFCLWPSNYSTHTVRESLWKDGKGDLLRELSDACKEYGLKFGVYLSPWDRNHPAYGTPQYNQIFSNTLQEVLGNYGHVFEQWFDGACGEGNNGKKQEYDWDMFHKTVYGLQPHAIIFSDVGPGCRWMGNESGVAGETNWSTLNIKGFGPGAAAPATDVLNTGDMNGSNWIPAETDVSIRPGWFYSESTNDKVKSLGKMVDIYHTSIGRNSNLLLNVPPDRRGLIHQNDSIRLMELKKMIEESYAVNLAKGAKASASNVRGSNFNEKNLFDSDYETYWATDDDKKSAVTEITLSETKTFNRIVLQEYLPLGQRVKAFSIDYWNGNDWQTADKQTTIGYKRILRLPAITTNKIRINIEEALACPVISEISVYNAPEILEEPRIWRNKQGVITIQSESGNPNIRYTTDGSEPSADSPMFANLLDMPGKVTVKAKCFDGKNGSATTTAEYDIAPLGWKIVSPQGNDAERAIDANIYSAYTIPADKAANIVVDLGKDVDITGFVYSPMAEKGNNITKYEFYAGTDLAKLQKIKAGAFDNIKNNPVKQTITFENAVKARYIKLIAVETVSGGKGATIAEIGVITAKQ